MNLDLDKPNWMEEAGIWTFGKAVSHIHVGKFHRSKDNSKQNRNADDGKITIAVAHDDNSMTIIKRSLRFLKRT